jgi:hypothetical protein
MVTKNNLFLILGLLSIFEFASCLYRTWTGDSYGIEVMAWVCFEGDG